MSLCRQLAHICFKLSCYVNTMKSLLSNNIDMKDLREVDVILVIKITILEKRIFLDQSH